MAAEYGSILPPHLQEWLRSQSHRPLYRTPVRFVATLSAYHWELLEMHRRLDLECDQLLGELLLPFIIDHIERHHHTLETSDGVARPRVHSEPSTTIISLAGDRYAAGGSDWHRNGWASASMPFPGRSGANNLHEAGHGVARPSVHSEPSTSIIYGVGDGDAAAGGGWPRNGWATTAYTIDVAASEQYRSVTGFNHHALESSNGVVRPSVHFEPRTTIISGAGDRDAAGGSGWHRNGWASAIMLFPGRSGANNLSEAGHGWGGANNPFWMSLWREIPNTLRILGIGAINNLKGGSLALSLIPFFVDQQPPLNTQDNIYMRIAFWCGVLAFLIVPLRVPGAESTRLARNRQVIGVTTLITGAVIFMVTAVEEKLRLLVLFVIFACIVFSLYLEKRELNETQLLPL